MKSKIIAIILILCMICLSGCGANIGGDSSSADAPAADSPTPDATLPGTENPDDVVMPGDFFIEAGSDAMFAVVLDPDATDYIGIGEPARVISAYEPDESPNFSLWLIPLKDGLQISVENINDFYLRFSDVPYTVREQFASRLGEYYLINAVVESWTGFESNNCVRIVAQDGPAQAAWLFIPDQLGNTSDEFCGEREYIVQSRHIPDGLDDYKMMILSEAAASAVWQYGEEFGWVNEYRRKDTSITPHQLAMSQWSYRQSILSLINYIDDIGLDDPVYDEKEDCYALTLFPGVRIEELTDYHDSYLTPVDTAWAMISAASADGNTGYVIVRIKYVNENGEFEDFYRVDWKANEPFDVYSPFQYHLLGVQPMERFLLGGQPYEDLSEKYLGSASEEALKRFGIICSIEYLDQAWGAESTMLLKAIGFQGNEEAIIYLMLDDNGERISYLGAYLW